MNQFGDYNQVQLKINEFQMQNQKLGANYADEEELDNKINELLVFF